MLQEQEPTLDAQPSDTTQKHSGCLTAFLALAVAGNAFLALFTWSMTSDVPSSLQPIVLFAGLLNLASIGFAIAIYKWKKWGVYGYVTCIGMTILLNLVLGDIVSAGRGLIPIALLVYLIRPSWSQME